ncbi:hypothetical protein BT96DRAFT_322824 [Gymnopus androsaceus JB14]|uniref:Uncharacterized protein n=1 Tax=Gymnopus androsaceus JB14 TaxID=1447944 RepID=A0A6A4H1E2_9AGAR|nr:hypothetical protein BT96DRAFT_322824 [Gymnopus androsaceus JB14]
MRSILLFTSVGNLPWKRLLVQLLARKLDIINRLGEVGCDKAEIIVSFTCLSLNSHPFLLLLKISSLEQHSENRAGRNVDQTQIGLSLSTRMRGSFYCIWHAARSNMYRFGKNTAASSMMI